MIKTGGSRLANISFRSLRGVLISMIVAAVLDQLSKYWILDLLRPGEGMKVFPGFFNLVLVFNPGAAFGFLAGLGDGIRQVVLGLTTFVALGTVIYFLIVDYFSDSLAKCGLGLVLGGAIGNVIDRIRIGEVVDFLDFYIGSYHWPAFNIADSAICIGVGILILRAPKKEGPVDPKLEAEKQGAGK